MGSRKWVLYSGIFLQVEYWQRYRVLKILIKTHYDILIKILIGITYCALWQKSNINWAKFWGRKMRPFAIFCCDIPYQESLQIGTVFHASSESWIVACLVLNSKFSILHPWDSSLRDIICWWFFDYYKQRKSCTTGDILVLIQFN